MKNKSQVLREAGKSIYDEFKFEISITGLIAVTLAGAITASAYKMGRNKEREQIRQEYSDHLMNQIEMRENLAKKAYEENDTNRYWSHQETINVLNRINASVNFNLEN